MHIFDLLEWLSHCLLEGSGCTGLTAGRTDYEYGVCASHRVRLESCGGKSKDIITGPTAAGSSPRLGFRLYSRKL